MDVKNAEMVGDRGVMVGDKGGLVGDKDVLVGRGGVVVEVSVRGGNAVLLSICLGLLLGGSFQPLHVPGPVWVIWDCLVDRVRGYKLDRDNGCVVEERKR